jgi:hypothetical protein
VGARPQHGAALGVSSSSAASARTSPWWRMSTRLVVSHHSTRSASAPHSMAGAHIAAENLEPPDPRPRS